MWINFYLLISVFYHLQSFSYCVWLIRKATIFRMRMGTLLVHYKHSQQKHLYTSLIIHTTEYLYVNNGITQCRNVLECTTVYIDLPVCGMIVLEHKLHLMLWALFIFSIHTHTHTHTHTCR
jgi:hypothetical protein